MPVRPAGPAAYMLPVVMGPHTVGKASQPSFSIKGRSKLGSFSDDLHKARVPLPGCSTVHPPGVAPLAPSPRSHQTEAGQLFILWALPHAWPHPVAPPPTHTPDSSLGVRRSRQWTGVQMLIALRRAEQGSGL